MKACVYIIYNDTDIYIGSTKSFKDRKYHHKKCCNGKDKPQPIHNYINDNGGWDNWKIEKVYEGNFIDKYDLYKKEREICDINWNKKVHNKRRPFITEEERIQKKKECDRRFHNTPIQKEKRRKYSKEHQNDRKLCKVCNREYLKRHFSSHLKTNKHINKCAEYTEDG